MAANKALTKRKLIKFFRDNMPDDTVGTDWNSTITVMSGKAGKEYSRWSGGTWFIAFEDSILMYMMNAWMDNKEWSDFFFRFEKFLTDHGRYHEIGEAWNMSIY